MKSTNKVELSGHIGAEPEVKTLSNGSKMLRFSLATSEDYKNNAGEWVKNTTWHNIVMWNKTAEKAAEILKKGIQLSLTGKLVNRQYTDKLGNKKNIFEILATTFELPAIA